MIKIDIREIDIKGEIDMIKRIMKMIIGVTIASFAISYTIKAGLGVFPRYKCQHRIK